MRITENITRNMYLRNHNRTQSNLLGSYNRIMTQRRFNRVSEDTINGNKALMIRRQLRNLDMYESNLNSAKELFNAAETNLTKIAHDLYISVEERFTAAANGTWSQEELDIFATELDEIAEEMVNCLNGDFGERAIFGGTNNSSAPFRLERVLMFDDSGDPVEQMDADGNYVYVYEITDEETGEPKRVTESELKEIIAAKNQKLKSDLEAEWKTALDAEGYLDEDGNIKAEYLDEDGNIIDDDVKAKVDDLTAELTDKYNEGADSIDNYTGEILKAKNVVYPPNWREYYEYDVNGNINLKEGLSLNDVPRTVLYNGVPIGFDAVDGDVSAGRYDVVTLNVPSNGVLDFKHSEFVLSEDTLKYARSIKDNSCIFPGSNPIYVDIGIGVRYDNNYEVDPQTVLDTGINGASVVGSGTEYDLDGVAYSKNLIQLVLDAAEALRNGDQSYVNAAIDRANNANGGVLTAITTLGTKQNDIDFYIGKMADDRFNFDERQNLIEGTDMEAEISNWYNLQAAYDAFLKIGTSVIPSSIFDFV